MSHVTEVKREIGISDRCFQFKYQYLTMAPGIIERVPRGSGAYPYGSVRRFCIRLTPAVGRDSHLDTRWNDDRADERVNDGVSERTNEAVDMNR